MDESRPQPNDRHAPVDVELRNPYLAALLAFLWPGAGHLYQRRYGKGALFMICLLSTFVFGLTLGGGRVVYASFGRGTTRYSYFLQAPIGIPAFPAFIQWISKKPPGALGDKSPPHPLLGNFMAAPQMSPEERVPDELAEWHAEYHTFFELGTLYTVVAGLLNVLVIYDAFAGPVFPQPEPPRHKPPANPPDAPDESKNS